MKPFRAGGHDDDGRDLCFLAAGGSLCGKAIGSRRSSTLGYERLCNGALRKKPEERWIHDLLQDMPRSPPYF